MATELAVAPISKTRLWDHLSKTDPKQTKKFTRGGGFSGTAIKPIWTILRMTEVFGPCGTGWGMDKPEFITQSAVDELLVFCTVGVWYVEGGSTGRVYGVGGDKYQVSQKNGLRASDEAYKMAYTDAIGNALKFIGVAADVHMGLFDDNKYVAEMGKEFSGEKPEPKPVSVTYITSEQAKRFRDAATGKGLAPAEVKKGLSSAGIASSAMIPATDFDDWMRWIDEAEVAQ